MDAEISPRSSMENKLFVYGTLTNPEIQQRVFGRVAQVVPDVLKGYSKSGIEVDGEKYPLIIPNEGEKIEGSVIDVTNSELRSIDEYETDAYERIKVVLESGMPAWCYVKNK